MVRALAFVVAPMRGSFAKPPQQAKSALAGDPGTAQDDDEKQATAKASLCSFLFCPLSSLSDVPEGRQLGSRESTGCLDAGKSAGLRFRQYRYSIGNLSQSGGSTARRRSSPREFRQAGCSVASPQSPRKN